ncbi:MAG TPA: winged helix DNA-binding domain-containing protein [Arthrobacter sp.]|nr:winged helix DNA-binding domain-containing protein [Arthrobacter sp.]
MEPDSVVQLRLQSQMLRGPAAESPEAALRRLLAVQAQEFAYARWSLAQRTAADGSFDVTAGSTGRAAAVTAARIEEAVADGRILRTHILRPTWHFVHRDDLRWLLALSAPRLHQGNAGMYRRTGIDAATAVRSGKVMAEAVAGGNHLTREQLAARLQDAGFEGKGLELAYLIMHAETSGVLVSGSPVRSRGGALKQTYALFDERVPAGPVAAPAREEALAELARRYFTSRGPATVKDCADWSGLTMADVRQGLHAALDQDPEALATAELDGTAVYYSADSQSTDSDSAGAEPGAGARPGRHPGRGAPSHAGPRIDLIQCYDEYVMGYSATRHYLGGVAPAVPQEGAPMHVVLLDGRLAGSWRHTMLPGRCELDIRLSGSGDPAPGPALDTAVQDALDRYGAFLGTPAVRVRSGSKLERHT